MRWRVRPCIPAGIRACPIRSAVIDQVIDVLLLILLVITAIAVVRIKSLFAVVMLFGIYSLITAGIFVVLDAVDVAFTEAAVGAGITTVLMLTTLARTGHKQAPARHSPALPLTVVIITGAVLFWGTQDMPRFADPGAPIHLHVADRYIEAGPEEVGVPNMVTAVLASYRGFDTLGEVAVVFTAGVGVLALLGVRRRRKGDGDG
jgi:multicomponent Na+:H+ antiporter subunit B